MTSSPKTPTTTTRIRAFIGLAALAALAAVSPRVGSAQSRTVPQTLPGTWVHDGHIRRGERTVVSAFASSIEALPGFLQGLARDRIRTSMAPPRRVELRTDGARVHVRLQSSERTTVIDGRLGARARVTGGDDGTRVTPRLEGGWLELLYEGEGSRARQLFSTEQDGSRMHVDYTVTSPRLDGPVRYRLDYVRPRG